MSLKYHILNTVKRFASGCARTLLFGNTKLMADIAKIVRTHGGHGLLGRRSFHSDDTFGTDCLKQ